MLRSDRIVALGLGIVGVLAVSLGAALLDLTTEEAGDDDSGGSPDGGAALQSGEGAIPVPELPTFLEVLLVALAIVLAVVLLVFFVANAREMIRIVIGMAIGIGIYTILIAIWLSTFPEGVAMQGGGPEGSLGPGGGQGEDVIPGGLVQFLVFLATLVMGLVGLLLLSHSRNTGDEDVLEEEPTAGGVDPAPAIGRAAGRAADRIESEASLDNAVYRAWLEMTQLLEVNQPETTTPGEFAQALVDEGIHGEHVDELTQLFEQVRYGHRPPTESRERRATSVLRRIETVYANGDTPAESVDRDWDRAAENVDADGDRAAENVDMGKSVKKSDVNDDRTGDRA